MAESRSPHDLEAVLKPTRTARADGHHEFTGLDNELELTVLQA